MKKKNNTENLDCFPPTFDLLALDFDDIMASQSNSPTNSDSFSSINF